MNKLMIAIAGCLFMADGALAQTAWAPPTPSLLGHRVPPNLDAITVKAQVERALAAARAHVDQVLAAARSGN